VKKIIAIIGLMGVGKTTIGLKIANRIGCYFIDSDQEIEDQEKKTISEIFNQNGEEYFRQIEEKIIKEILLREEKIVLSLGGGAFINSNTRKILKEKSITIWLDASIEDILFRIGNKENRPLLNGVNKRLVLEELLKKRHSIYSEANLKFNTSIENQEQIIEKIIKQTGLTNE
jgi:shikimate kinase